MLEFIGSTRSYLIGNISENRGTSTSTVQYILIFAGIYIVGISILHKTYRGFCLLSKMKRADFLLACDTILYHYQKERKGENLSRIQELITSGSYENNYKVLLEKAKDLGGETSQALISKLKWEYGKYKSSIGMKTIIGSVLMLITLGIYFIFWEN